jgi:hypothetical protein
MLANTRSSFQVLYIITHTELSHGKAKHCARPEYIGPIERQRPPVSKDARIEEEDGLEDAFVDLGDGSESYSLDVEDIRDKQDELDDFRANESLDLISWHESLLAVTFCKLRPFL